MPSYNFVERINFILNMLEGFGYIFSRRGNFFKAGPNRVEYSFLIDARSGWQNPSIYFEGLSAIPAASYSSQLRLRISLAVLFFLTQSALISPLKLLEL
jgi:hypothetical protein